MFATYSIYLETASRFLTPLEVSLLPYAAELFPYMQCVRFLWDYLSGDHYWKCQYADHNLTRARNQWHLFLKAKEHEAETTLLCVAWFPAFMPWSVADNGCYSISHMSLGFAFQSGTLVPRRYMPTRFMSKMRVEYPGIGLLSSSP